MSSEKTEHATPKKLQEARKKGSVARSTDLASAVTLLAVICALAMGHDRLLDVLRKGVRDALDFVAGDRSPAAFTATLIHMLRFSALCCLAIALVGMIGALIGSSSQAGLQFSLQPVMPKLDSINPASGMKRIFSARSVMEIVKMLVKTVILSAVLWRAMIWLFPLTMRGVYEPLDQLAELLWSAVMRVVEIALVLYIAIGAFDYLHQRWQFARSMRMSKDEVKQEHRNSDGDPKIKHERRKRARELIQGARNNTAMVARANAVVVNPTHYAVAVRYVPQEYPLPVILAKGTDAEALRLRHAATLYDVPIVANPPVARALHELDVDTPIPEEMFEVVAAILRWVEALGAKSPDTRDTAAPLN